MKGSDKAVVLGVVIAVVLAGFYFMVLSPKRDKASTLGKDISDLKAQISQQEQTAQFGEAARQDFPAYYGRLVVLGKAVPAEADSASLLVQLNSVANRSGVKFVGLTLGEGSGDSAATPASTPTTPSASSTSTTSSSSTTSTTPSGSGATSSSSQTTSATTTPTPATESSAASLPIGAVVGAAGLPTLPYEMSFTGSYFDVANFIKGVDDFVHVHGTSQVASDGRLLTINGFSFSFLGQQAGQDPTLKVDLSVTSYVTPASQGLTAGASPTGPAPSLTAPQTQPASQTVSP
jgi:Tfp pilus assembly protein PilO